MLKLVHIWGSYLYLLTFLIATALCGLSLLRRQIWLERLCAWTYVFSFVCLAVAYACGFTPEAELANRLPQVLRLAQRHHELAKFALTGMILIAGGALAVLFKFRQQRFPSWFLPNTLFLSLMILSFSGVSLSYIWKFENHPRKAELAPVEASPSPAP